MKSANGVKLAKAVATYGAPIDIAPADAMQSMIATAFGHMTWLGALIAGAGDLESVPELVLARYDVERNLLAKMTRDAHGAGIAERQVRLAEEQGRMLAGLVRNVVADVFRLLLDAHRAAGPLDVAALEAVQIEAVPGVIRARFAEIVNQPEEITR